MFDFGLTKPAGLPVDEPPPRPALVYTAWHIWRVLKYHRLDIAAGKKNYTVPPIFNAFKVTCLVSPVVVPLSDSEFRTDAKKDLRVVRLFQSFRRTKNGTVEYVKIPPPLKPREQAAILLYALLPGEEGEKCSCCMAYDGSGPFRLCIGSSERWTGGACLNCYYTGTGSKCDLRISERPLQPRCQDSTDSGRARGGQTTRAGGEEGGPSTLCSGR